MFAFGETGTRSVVQTAIGPIRFVPYGGGDIWVSERNSIESEWMEPMNLGPQINSSGNDDLPSITADGRMLVFTSTRAGGRGNRDLWISTRDKIDDDWKEPVNLGSAVNTSDYEANPEISAAGSLLLFSRCCGGDLWQVPLSPLESVPVTVGGDEYVQDFDDALSTDTGRGENLPTGWAISDNALIFENATTDVFPETSRISSRSVPIYNAGEPNDTDRALTIGVANPSNAPMLQLLTEVATSDSTGFQLQFDVEAWDAANVTTLGEAAFDVTVELDAGDGFSPLADLGRVTTGPELFPPAGEYVNGNNDTNRVEFVSDVIKADIPDGSKLRIRWAPATAAQSTGWVFGLDNVKLSLFGDASPVRLVAGDAVQDLDFDQLDLVQVQIAATYLTGQAATWGEGDWNGAPGGQQGNPPPGDGLFNQFDIIAAQRGNAYLTGPYGGIEPNGQNGDGQTSVIYNTSTGEVSVDAPAGVELTSINIDSAAGIFTGEAAANLGGSFDNNADANIFKATFGGSFGSVSFGNVAQTGLAHDFLLSDFTVVGSLAGGGDLGNVRDSFARL